MILSLDLSNEEKLMLSFVAFLKAKNDIYNLNSRKTIVSVTPYVYLSLNYQPSSDQLMKIKKQKPAKKL